MSFEQELIESQLTGRWSFTFTVPAAGLGQPPGPYQQAQLLSADLPAYASRSWTVTLLAWQYSSGVLATAGELAGTPPENQTFSGATSVNPGLKVAVQWGVDGSMENALVDYPARGCTFQLTGGGIRIGLTGVQTPNASPTPIVGGFLTPTPRTSLGPICNPTYTIPVQLAPVGGNLLIPIPRRAVAYQAFTAEPTLTASFALDQVNSQDVIISRDGVFPFAVGTPPIPYETASDYIRLLPSAQYVSIFNLDSLAARVIGIRFLLDLA